MSNVTCELSELYIYDVLRLFTWRKKNGGDFANSFEIHSINQAVKISLKTNKFPKIYYLTMQIFRRSHKNVITPFTRQTFTPHIRTHKNVYMGPHRR